MGNVGKRDIVDGLGNLVLQARGNRKQQDFADSLGISLRNLGEIERKSLVSSHSMAKLLKGIPSLAASQILADSIHGASGNKSFEELTKLATLNLSHDIKSHSLQNRSEIEVRKLIADVDVSMMAAYLQGGNPLICYTAAVHWLKAGRNSEGANSYELGVLSLDLGYLLVQSDYDASLVETALSHFADSIDIFSKTHVLTHEGWKNLLRAHWLKAVALKMQGDADGALRELDAALTDRSLIPRSNASSRAPLERQKTLILQTKKEFAKLELGVKHYQPDSIEVFHTSRRLWEFALNDRNKSASARFAAQTSLVYSRVRKHVEPIYRIAFFRAQLYQFLLDGKVDSAERLKNELVQKCEALQLYGQRRQILSLWESSQKMHHASIKLKNEVFPKS